MTRVTGSLSPLTVEFSEQLRMHLRRMLVRLDELRALASNPATWTPPVDVYETEEAVLISIEVPGISINQVRIKILDNVLKVEGQKERTTPTARLLSEPERPIRFICLERSYGNFSLSVPVNWQIESEKVSAQLREGLLQIHLPKTKNNGREITVLITE